MKLLPSQIKKIGVFRALQLGDMLNIIPALRALRAAYPDAEISLFGLPWAASFVKRFNLYFNRFIHFPGYPGLPEQMFHANDYELFLQNVKNESFDLILQMQGNGTLVNEMLQSWGAKHLAGFYNEESVIESDLFMSYPDYGSEIWRHLLLMKHLQIPLLGDELEFSITAEDMQEFDKLDLPLQKKQYVCIHPGSRGAWRQWPPDYFAQLADYCVEKGFAVIVTGTKEETDITSCVMKYMQYDAINLTGKTNLGAIALLIKNAFCLIANCTGVSHIASATQTPSVIISMDGEPERWSPLNQDMHFVTDWTKHPDIQLPYQNLVTLFDKFSDKQDERKENFLFNSRWLSN